MDCAKFKKMKVILLEKIGKLGKIGDIVNVASGYARNFLLPQKKSLRANKENLAYFAEKKAEIEEKNAKLRASAESEAQNLNNISISLVRQASDSGFLFGSVRPADIVAELEKKGVHVSKGQLRINNSLKTVGTYQIGIQLHPEVIVNIILKIEAFHQQNEEEINEQEEAAQPNE